MFKGVGWSGVGGGWGGGTGRPSFRRLQPTASCYARPPPPAPLTPLQSGEKTTSLTEYVSRMQVNQTQVFYATGDSKAAAARSPVLEKLRKLNIEVRPFTHAHTHTEFRRYLFFLKKGRW